MSLTTHPHHPLCQLTATSKEEETIMNGKARGEGLEAGSTYVVLTLAVLAATSVALRWLFFSHRKKPPGGSESKKMLTNPAREGRQGDQQEHSSGPPGQKEGPISPAAPTSKVSNKSREKARSCGSCGNTRVLKVSFVCDGCQMQNVIQDRDIVHNKGITGHRADTKPRDRHQQEAIYSANTPSTLFPKQETVSTSKANDLGLLRDSLLTCPLTQTWGTNNNELQHHTQRGLERCFFKINPENQTCLRLDSTGEDNTGLDAGALGNQSTHCSCNETLTSLGVRKGRGNEKLFTAVEIDKDNAKKLKTHLQPFPQDDTNQLLQTEQSKTQDSDLETCPEGIGDGTVDRVYCFTSVRDKEVSFTTASISACLQNSKDSTVLGSDTDDHRNHRQSQGDPFKCCGQCPDEDLLLILSHAESSREDRQQTMEIHSPESNTQDSHCNSSSSETKSTSQNENPDRRPGLLEWEKSCITAFLLSEEKPTTAESSGVELRNDDSGSGVYLNREKEIHEQNRVQPTPGQSVVKYSTENTNLSHFDNANFQLSSTPNAKFPDITVSIKPGYCPQTKDLLPPVNKDYQEWRTEHAISSMEPHEGQLVFAKEHADFSHSIHADFLCLYCDEVNINAKTFLETENLAADHVQYQMDITCQPSYSATWHCNKSSGTKDNQDVKEEYEWIKEKRIGQSNQEISLNSIPEKETEEKEVFTINAMSYTDSSTTQDPETSESGYTSKNITPVTEAKSWSSLGMYSQEDGRIYWEEEVIQQQMDCTIESKNGMVNKCQVTFQEQSGELTTANDEQNRDDDNEKNCIIERNDIRETKQSKFHSLFKFHSLEFGRSSSEIQPYNTTDNFLQGVNEEERYRDCHLHLQGQLDIQLQDYCLEDKKGSRHESTKHKKPLNESYSAEASCKTALNPIRVTKRTSKEHEQEHTYHMTNNTDLVDACETEDLRHGDCAVESDYENLVKNNDGLIIKHTDTDFAGITFCFQDELYKPNRTHQRAAARFLSLNKTGETGNSIIMPSEEGQKINTCQHLTRSLSEEPSASKITISNKTSFENRNKELHVEDPFHNDLLLDKTTNQSSSKICRERTSAEVPGNQTMTEETQLANIRHNAKREGSNEEPKNMEAMVSGFPTSPEVTKDSQNGFSKEVLAPMPLSSTVRVYERESWPENTQLIPIALAVPHNIVYEMGSTTGTSKYKILTDSACIKMEGKEPRSQHAALPSSVIQGQFKVLSGKHLLQRKGSMPEIAEKKQITFQVNSIFDHKPKLSLITRSCEDILSEAPKEKINRRNKAQSVLCLLTEHYSQYPRGQGSPVEFVSKGSFIHIPESLQDIVNAMKLQLTLGNCLELLRFAKKHAAVDLQAAAYAVMSDNYLQVLRDSSLYGQLSGGERDQILRLRMRGKKVLGTVTLQNIYSMRSNSQSQSCSLGINLPSPSLTIDSQQKPWLYTFHLDGNSWHPLTPVPQEANLKGCGICSMHNYLFLAGGIQGEGQNTKCSNKVFCYNPLTEIWTQLAPMNQARSQMKLVPVNGYLYAIGGECLYTVERYDPRFDKWTFRASLPTGSFAVAHEAANCNGDIYVSGGNLFYRLFRYIPLKDLWEECPYNSSRKRSSDMVAVRSFLYRFDSHRDFGVSVFRYNTITRVWDECATLCLKILLPFRCTVLDDTIYCLNKKMTARFFAHDSPPRFELENLCPFPDKDGGGVLCPFVLSLPQFGCFQTPV